uniref:Uncharacterized protein n=1 Tax=Sphaeramia orbicularis TaxID=375764 RepID=A0A672YF33_9TELE
STIQLQSNTEVDLNSIAINLWTHHVCSCHINYEDCGHCSEPLTPVIVPSDTGGGVFVKNSWATSGSVGVITYDIKKEGSGETKRLAIMYSVPYSYVTSSNWFAVGIFDRFTPCNQQLFNKMYYDSGPFTRGKASDGEITYKSDGITLKATMSNEKPIAGSEEVNISASSFPLDYSCNST